MLDEIELFTTTVAAGSFASAARRLRVTPSAVSRRIARLESELGAALFSRTTRSLRLTDDGQAFHTRCVRIVEELRDARDALARAAKPSGTLRVDAPVAFGRARLPALLARFLDRYPDVRVCLTLNDRFVDPLAEGIDVCIRVGPLRDSSLIARRLGATRVICVASPAYLAKHGAPAHPRDLARHACIGYLREGRPDPFHFAGPRGPIDVEIDGAFHANDADVIRHFVLAHRGIAKVFDFLVEKELASGRLVHALPAYPGVAWPIHALYPKNRHLVPKVGAFLDFLAEDLGARRRDTARQLAI